MKCATLKRNILELSVAKNFYKARREWFLYRIVITENWRDCLCGKKIRELCYLKNKMNANIVRVGNICTRDTMNLNAPTFFNALKEMRTNISSELNAMRIEGGNFKAYVQHHWQEEDKNYDERLKLYDMLIIDY